MKLTVGTTPVRMPFTGRVTPIVQNLGPGNVYLDADPNVSEETGLMMTVGTVYEFPRDLGGGGGFIYLVADADDCDVRIARVG